MTDKELIKTLKSIVGFRIIGISYIQTKFHYPNSDGFAKGDWTKMNPDIFVLHSPEWQLKLSDGQSLFVSGQQLTDENFSSKFCINKTTKATQDDTVLNVPIAFEWLSILNKPITKFRLWHRVSKSPRFLGRKVNLGSRNHFKIIELVCDDIIFSLTLMSGDIGDMTFYPTGALGERVGVFFNKTICSSHTVYDLTMRMAPTYKST